MKFLRKIWSIWKIKVDKRNATLGYVLYEEAWNYTTPFSIIINPLLTFIIGNLASLSCGKLMPLSFSLGLSFIVFIITALWLVLHWRVYKE